MTSSFQEQEYHKSFTGCLIDRNGVKRWFINGAYGREGDHPAIEHPDGAQHWYIENPKRGSFGARNSVEHRENGPAIIRANGDQFWYLLGKLHRGDDLPAIELADGTRKWFVEGNFVRQEFAAKPATTVD